MTTRQFYGKRDKRRQVGKIVDNLLPFHGMCQNELIHAVGVHRMWGTLITPFQWARQLMMMKDFTLPTDLKVVIQMPSFLRQG